MRPATARPNVRRARAAAAGRSVARVTRFAVGNGRLGRLKRGHAMWGSAADYLKSTLSVKVRVGQCLCTLSARVQCCLPCRFWERRLVHAAESAACERVCVECSR